MDLISEIQIKEGTRLHTKKEQKVYIIPLFL